MGERENEQGGRENQCGGEKAERQQPEGVLLLFQMFHREGGKQGGRGKEDIFLIMEGKKKRCKGVCVDSWGKCSQR